MYVLRFIVHCDKHNIQIYENIQNYYMKKLCTYRVKAYTVRNETQRACCWWCTRQPQDGVKQY